MRTDGIKNSDSVKESFKVAIIVQKFPAVTETFVFNKVLNIINAGFQVTVICHDFQSDAHLYRERLAGRKLDFVVQSPVAAGSLSRRVGNLLDPATLRAGIKAIQIYQRARPSLQPRDAALMVPFIREQFDLIHFEFSGLAVAYRKVLPYLKPAKLVVSCRGFAEQIKPVLDPSRGDALREIMPYFDAVHCVSERMADRMAAYGLDRRRAFVNYPSIDPEKFKRHTAREARTAGPLRITSVGALGWRKGFHFAVLAIKHLVDRGFDVEFHQIGGGDSVELKFSISELGLSDRVHLHGSLPAEKVRDLLEQTDVYIQPSLSEGVPNATMEAMAMELPVVVTNVDGFPELVRDGVEGFLVPSRDPLAMADKIAVLLQSPEMREQFGRRGRERVKSSFHLALQAQRFNELYHSLLMPS